MSDKILELNGFDFEKTIKESKVPVLVDFWAAWCSPCRMQAPVLNEIADELGEKILVAKVNVDESGTCRNAYKIYVIASASSNNLKSKNLGNLPRFLLSKIIIKLKFCLSNRS